MGIGSIAAVKSPLLVSRLVKAGAEVRCLVTPSGQAGQSLGTVHPPVVSGVFQESDEWDPTCARLHIELAEWAELMVLAPLSASSLSRWSQGLADGLLASTLLASRSAHRGCDSQNTAMWNHPAVQSNWERVQGHPGVVPLLPEAGLLACDRLGDGRMADPQRIELAVRSVFSRDRTLMDGLQDWSGRRLLVTAGPTLELIDAPDGSAIAAVVMGVLLAQAARLRGADVDLVHGPLDVPKPGWSR